MEFHRLIAARRSLRAYSSRPVEPEKIERMLEAARWSPSCDNRQSWRFVVVGSDAPERAGGGGGARPRELLGAPGAGADRRGGEPSRRLGGRGAGILPRRRGPFADVPRLPRRRPGTPRAPDGGLEGGAAARRAGAAGRPSPRWPSWRSGTPGTRKRSTSRRASKDEKPRVRKPIGEIAFEHRLGRAVPGDAGRLPREGLRDGHPAPLPRHRRDGARQQRHGRVVPGDRARPLPRRAVRRPAGGGHPVHHRGGLLQVPDAHPSAGPRARADVDHGRLPQLVPLPVRGLRPGRRAGLRRGRDGAGDVRLRREAPHPPGPRFPCRGAGLRGGG